MSLAAPIAPPQKFDLTEAATYRYRFNQQSRIVLLVTGTGYFALWALLLPQLWSKLSGAEDCFNLALQVAFFATGPLILGAALYVVFWRMSMPPTELQVTDAGLRFGGPRRQKIELWWGDPKLDVVLRDHRGVPSAIPLMAFDIILRGRGPFPIPAEAFGLIQQAARDRGLRITQTSGDEFDVIRGSKVFHIRAPKKNQA